ncbi:hypothetical protein TRICI_002837 [Trichomonascus ciferrii]|uniref:tRNA wybutosine-synthesizing protein 2 n=1 Tax=Trichomonascus ciferrii TaxID=44093 RepID=A0A642V5K3_9ASCO|nr:hypothetical protein TRICI_002837 [Trichomonascus ciferrii]
MVNAVRVTDKSCIKPLKDRLEREGVLHKRLKIAQDDGGTGFLIPLNSSAEIPADITDQFELVKIADDVPLEEQKKLPISKWSLYPPMALLPYNCPDITTKQAEMVAKTLNVSHIARNSPISDQNDIVRKPHIVPIYGDFGPEPTPESVEHPSKDDFEHAFWASSVQNGIRQCWAPRYTMFSRGNIHEKTRVLNSFASQATIKDHVVVDMYAGIGYFALAYAAQGPHRVFCWEINPWSVHGLVKGAQLNNWPVRVIQHDEEYIENENDFIIVFLEDNKNAPRRLNELSKPITHINLGLLPHSKLAWQDSLSMASKNTSSPCIIHIHENVAQEDLPTYPQQTLITLQSLNPNLQISFLHLEKIKTFAPAVWHICADYKISQPATTG